MSFFSNKKRMCVIKFNYIYWNQIKMLLQHECDVWKCAEEMEEEEEQEKYSF